jgi:MFS family permease
MLALLALAELLGMSPWFAATAVSGALAERWSLDAAGIAWLSGVVQLGFVAGTAVAAVLNLADLVPSRFLLAASSVLAGAANAALLAAPGAAEAFAARFATGFFLAGVYPPAMKMAATWFRGGRGLAIGTVVGALTVGKAGPYLLEAMPAADPAWVTLATSAQAVLAALLVALLYRDGPFPFPRRRFDWRLTGEVLLDRPTRLAIASYLGHMWELYAMWVWIPAFLAASAVARAAAGHAAASPAAVEAWSFGAIAAGGLGCVWGGLAAGRVGYVRVVVLSMTLSGLCALSIGGLFGASPWLVVPLAWAWGFFVVADSAQFSALVTEVAPQHAVGTALTLQVSMGFLLTLATIQLVPVLVELWGWRWAFPALALGPAAGIATAARIGRR